MAPHSSTLAWRIPWTEGPGRLQSMGLLRVGHDWVTSLWLFTFMHWRRQWQPIPVFAGSRHVAYCILSAALSTASSFRIWNSSTGIISLPGASVRSSTHDKGHWGRRLGIRKGGIEPQESPWKFSSIYPQNQSLPTFGFVLSPTPLTLQGLSPTTSLWKKS